MKPLKLSITGLQSFNQTQTIDFEQLSKFQMFGIFGQTASGKSTILDAITLSLYGEIVRNNGSSAKGLNQNINYNSNEIIVDFTFLVNDKKLRILRRYSRKKTDLSTVEPRIAKIFQITDQEVLLGDKTSEIAAILFENFQITKDDFYKSVILPQGKFSDFLKLKNASRSEMLARIFGLNIYGKPLADTLSTKLRETQNSIDTLNTHISDVDYPNELKNQTTKLEQLKSEHQKSAQEFNKIELEITKLKNLDQKYSDFQSLNYKLETHLKELPVIQKLDQSTAVLEKLSSHKSKIDEYQNFKKQIVELKGELTTITDASTKLTKTLDKLSNDRTQIDLTITETTTKIKNLDYNLDEVTRQYKVVDELKNQLQIATIYQNITTSITNLTANSADLEENIGLITTKLKQIEIPKQVTLDNYNNQLEQLLLLNTSNEKLIMTYTKDLKTNLDLVKQITCLKQDAQNNKENLDLINSKLTNNLATQLASNLKKGQNCPVCGSLEHPNLASLYQTYDEHIKIDLEKKAQSLELKINTLQLKIENFKLQYNQINLDDLKETHTQNIKKYDSLKSDYQILQKQQQTALLANQEYQTNLEHNQKALEINKKQLTKLNTELTQITKVPKASTQIQAQIVTQEIHLNEILAKQQVHLEYQSLLTKQTQQLTLINDQYNSSQTKLEGNKNLIATINAKLEQLYQTFEIAKNSLTNTLAEMNLTLEQVLKIKLDHNQILLNRSQVTQYSTTTMNLKQQIKNAKVTTPINKEQLSHLISKHQTLDLQNQEALTLIGKTTEQITQLQIQISEQKIHLDNLKVLTTKHTQIEQLYQVVAKNKFMNTLIAQQLNTILITATSKIKQMTNGQYELIDHENEFYIIDNFNNGVKRSSHTLSGGETFIISLCLCLALSQHLQLKSNTKLDFFFLDEGFGSLDEHTLQTVMTILEQTKLNDNITIGIISHVQAIKNQVPIHLNVAKDADNQTITKISY